MTLFLILFAILIVAFIGGLLKNTAQHSEPLKPEFEPQGNINN